MVSIVVPVCNEEANLPELRARLTAALAGHAFEYILVDDGSTDAAAAIIRDMAREDARFKLVSLSRNFGHQAAIFAGLTFARGACVAVMDGDLQDPPELIPEMVRVWAKGAEVVYGVRTARKERWYKRAAAAIFYRIQTRLTPTKMPLDTGDFAVMDRRVVDLIVGMGERHPYVRGLRSWVGFRQVAFPYERDRRRQGEAKYTLWKLMDLAVAGIVPFSVMPLRLVALAGAGICSSASRGSSACGSPWPSSSGFSCSSSACSASTSAGCSRRSRTVRSSSSTSSSGSIRPRRRGTGCGAHRAPTSGSSRAGASRSARARARGRPVAPPRRSGPAAA